MTTGKRYFTFVYFGPADIDTGPFDSLAALKKAMREFEKYEDNPDRFSLRIAVYDNLKSAQEADISDYGDLDGYVRSYGWHEVQYLKPEDI